MILLDALTKEEREEYEGLKQDVKDYEKSVEEEREAIRVAQKFLYQSEVLLAEAIINLDKFKRAKTLNDYEN